MASYTYDVALSYSSADAGVARSLRYALQRHGLSVYHDRSEKLLMWGRHLEETLAYVYQHDARYCVILVSRAYLESRYTAIERRAAIERQRASGDYILPVKLDDTRVSSLFDGLVSLDIGEGVIGLADIIASRLGHTYDPPPLVASTDSTVPVSVEGFTRILLRQAHRITDRYLVDRCWELSPTAGAGERARLAQDMARGLPRSLQPLGYPYTVWRADEITVFFSSLPSMVMVGQKTIEMRLEADGLVPVAEWSPSGGPWGPMAVDEFHDLFSGVMADRSGCDMNRESAIRVMLARGAHFDFPVSPPGTGAEGLCGWRTEEPRQLLYDWDRDPRLASPNLVRQTPAHHYSERCAVVIYRIQGSWNNAALRGAETSFEALLPGRSDIRVVERGVRRITVVLTRFMGTWPTAGEVERVRRAAFRCDAAIARVVAAGRGLRLPAPDPVADLDDEGVAFALAHILDELGDEEFAELGDDSDSRFRWGPQSPWAKLRQSAMLNIEDIIFADHPSSNDGLVQHIAVREIEGR